MSTTSDQPADRSAGLPADQPAERLTAQQPAEPVIDAGPVQPERPRPRTGPIVWGCLILAFCAYAVQRVLFPGGVDTALWITATVLGLGALLLGVGIAIAIRSARRR